MPPEIALALAGVFVLGSAIGSAGTLFAQWILNRFSGPEQPGRVLESTELRLLRADIHDMSRHVHNLDARLEFTERLLGGALTPAPPPSPFQPSLPADAGAPDASPGASDDGTAGDETSDG